MSESGKGLGFWHINPRLAEKKPLLAVASALTEAVTIAQENPHTSWPQPLRTELAQLAHELHTLNDSAQGHGPAVQLSLIISHIDMRTGFNARFALQRMPREVARPLFNGRRDDLSPAQQQAVRDVESGLNDLAADLLHLRAKFPVAAPQ